jgi:NAD(P)-dependent dehydrogenase (short-subunit alcohol dehydrogenase family)
MTNNKGVALVTGASSGIGEAIAIAMHDAGYVVYAGARRVERMASLRSRGIVVLELDVTDDPSMQAAVEQVHREVGRIEVLVNNAGYGSYGALEDVPMSEARRQIEVNVFGLARLCQLVIPEMRQARRGTIINISSVGGKFGEPFGVWYHASKFAVEGLSDSLALELAPFGVHVVAVEPGGIKTEWAGISADNLVATSGSGDYSVSAMKAARAIRGFNDMKLAGTAEQVADGVMKILAKRRPKFRYAVAGGAKPLLVFRKLTNDRIFYSMFRLVTRA